MNFLHLKKKTPRPEAGEPELPVTPERTPEPPEPPQAPEPPELPDTDEPRKKGRWKLGKPVLTYRTRRRLRGFGITCAVLAVLAAFFFLTWFAWLERYVVYSKDGARLDFEGSFQPGEPQEVTPPDRPTVEVYYNEGDQEVETSYDLEQLQMRYVTGEMLMHSIAEVDSQLSDEDHPVPAVILDLKSIYGSLYYSSQTEPGSVSDQMDVTAVDRLIEKLDASGTYLIARLPAFRDYAYGLEHLNDGLSVSDGSHLWADEQNCYWLDPTSTNVLSRLIALAGELRSLGFDEVLFTDFTFPDTYQLEFDGDRAAAIANAAATLVSSCTTDRFAISFQTADPNFPLPAGRTRMYLTDVTAVSAKAVFDGCTLPQPAAQLVFLTESSDTRFDLSSVARPLPVGDFLTVETEPTETTAPTETTEETGETEETESDDGDSDSEDD